MSEILLHMIRKEGRGEVSLSIAFLTFKINVHSKQLRLGAKNFFKGSV